MRLKKAKVLGRGVKNDDIFSRALDWLYSKKRRKVLKVRDRNAVAATDLTENADAIPSDVSLLWQQALVQYHESTGKDL
ncbi:hypothetical protein ACJ73_04630 [Blastomyces percursus]|uniref:Uncharacterized protein n=1 Tax=Blastomyces percursus TaxID=1658174 RepID=A0A1J9R7N5_9EURO|nr:hypothetical protein ACJ73_04630 [Blastomyces percursus]